MGSEQLHEPSDSLSESTHDMHRALVSLMEELEAADWYQQRVDACGDEDLRAILHHNRNEEIEHAMMLVEWLRRRDPTFAANCRRFLFSKGPITDQPAVTDAAAPTATGALGIGSLKGDPTP